MTPPIVGLVGRKRSGKDSLATNLIEHHGFARFAFADPLRAVLLDTDPHVHGIGRLRPFVELVGWERAKERPEVRRLLQALGVAVREHVDSAVWLNATMRRAAASPWPVVITDVRFPNEADAIEAAGGLLVRVHRPGLPADDLHVSETALDDRLCALHVLNAGDLGDLRQAAATVAFHAGVHTP